MNWGYKIALVFIGFVGLMVSLVIICFRQKDIHLVEEQYYEKEIAYQEQINIQQNTVTLVAPPTIKYIKENQAVTIHHPLLSTGAFPEGSILFFRPSDAAMDFVVPLFINEMGNQVIPIDHLEKGLWKVKMEWTTASKKFYLEEKLVLL